MKLILIRRDSSDVRRVADREARPSVLTAADAVGVTVFPGSGTPATVYLWEDVDREPFFDTALVEELLLSCPDCGEEGTFLFIYPEEYRDFRHKRISSPIKNYVYADEFCSRFGISINTYLKSAQLGFRTIDSAYYDDMMLRFYARHLQAQMLLIDCLQYDDVAEEVKLALKQEIDICTACRGFALRNSSPSAQRCLQEDYRCYAALMKKEFAEGHTTIDQMKNVYQGVF